MKGQLMNINKGLTAKFSLIIYGFSYSDLLSRVPCVKGTEKVNVLHMRLLQKGYRENVL